MSVEKWWDTRKEKAKHSEKSLTECRGVGICFVLTHHLSETGTTDRFIVDEKNQLDVTFCILYFSSNSCSTCFGQPCAHHQELTTA